MQNYNFFCLPIHCLGKKLYLCGIMEKEKALNRAAALCSGSEHCEAEIVARLQIWEVSVEDIASIMSRLTSEGFVDDRRYARAFVHDRLLYSHWGRLKIAQALRIKGVDDKIVAEAITRLDDDLYNDYRQALSDTVQSKMRTLKPASNWQGQQQNRAKIMRHAASRGFTPDEIFSVLSAIQ